MTRTPAVSWPFSSVTADSSDVTSSWLLAAVDTVGASSISRHVDTAPTSSRSVCHVRYTSCSHRPALRLRQQLRRRTRRQTVAQSFRRWRFATQVVEVTTAADAGRRHRRFTNIAARRQYGRWPAAGAYVARSGTADSDGTAGRRVRYRVHGHHASHRQPGAPQWYLRVRRVGCHTRFCGPTTATTWFPHSRKSRLGRSDRYQGPGGAAPRSTLPRRLLVLSGVRAMEGPWSTILAALDPRRLVSRRSACSVVLCAARDDLSTVPLRYQNGSLVALSHIVAWSACTSQLITVVIADVWLDTD